MIERAITGRTASSTFIASVRSNTTEPSTWSMT